MDNLSSWGECDVNKIRYVWILALACRLASAATLDFGVLGDAGEWNASNESTRDSMLRLDVRGLILPGDNLYDPKGKYEDVWNPWTSLGFTFGPVAIGNHNGGYAEEMAFFGMPNEFYAQVHPGLARFVVLNSDNTKTAAAQARFLGEQLRAATEPFVFVVYHHPSYALSHFHGSWEKAAFHRAVRPVLFANRAKITSLIVGHDHLALLAHFNDLPVVLSGASMEQRGDSPINCTEAGVKVRTNWYYDQTAHWTHLHLDSDARTAEVTYVRSSDDRVSCTVHIETGKPAELDANCLEKAGG